MQLRFTRYLLLFVLSVLSIYGHAQNGTIRGFVYEEKTGEPVIFTNVYLKGTTVGASTDVNGYFSIPQIPPGEYELTVTYLGYDTLSQPVSVTAGRIETIKLFMKQGSVQMAAVEISAERQEAKTNVTMSVVKATPKEIKQIPAVGGVPDLAQYLQVLPGVIFTGDQGGQLFIRGGSPVQNLVLLDGMVIYNPFHSIGLFSVFDTEIIRTADVYTGGYGSEFGGRISAVMDVTTKDGNKRRTTGKVSVSTFGANALVEGPIVKQTNSGKGSSSYILSAKHSYLDQSSKLFYQFVDENGLPFRFTDLYGKLSFNATNGSKFNVFGFNFNDAVSFQQNSDLEWKALGGGLNFVLVPDGSPVLIEGQFSISDYNITLIEQPSTLPGAEPIGEDVFLEPRTSGISNFNLGINFKYFNGDNALTYGVDITGFGTELSYFSPIGQRLELNSNSTELAGFFAYKMNIDNLVLDLGFRAQYYSSIRVFRPEPRVGAKYNLTEKLRLKAAAGLYSQNLISTTSDKDVVNLFYGFLVAPENIQREFTDRNGNVNEVKTPLQTAYHTIAGFEYDITNKFSANVEGYLKKFTQLTEINRNKVYPSGTPNVPDELRNDFIVEDGRAVGLDFTFKYTDREFYVWAVYSLSEVDRWDGVRVYNPIFDRRHNINLVASYSLGKNNLWEINGRWNYGSGFPFTQNQGFYLRETFNDGLNTDITNTNSENAEIQYAELNQGRLPDYHRLDITVSKRFLFSENSTLEASFSVTNIYNRENIFYVDRLSGDRVNQLPLLPSAALTFTF